MTDPAVVIAGGGPTGLMLAGELALAGIDVAVVERRGDQTLTGSRAGGLHARTLEILDQRGIVDRFLAAGQQAQVAAFSFIPLDISDFPTRHNYGLGLWQNRIEQLLADWVGELGVRVQYGVAVESFAQDESGVRVELSDGRTLHAAYLVGCDGGRSVVRKCAGIDFPGWDASMSCLIGEVEMTDPPELGIKRTSFGVHAFGREKYEIREGRIVYDETGPVRVMVTEREVGTGGDPTLRELCDALVAVHGSDCGAHSPIWLSRFTDNSRQAARYRDRRVLLAGDAAHVHAPTGGQGLNLGVQDAVNLAWKLAQVIRGVSPDALLDTYHAERHPVAARVLRHTMAQVALMRTDERTSALHASMTELLQMEEPRRRYAGMMSGLDLHYDLGDGHPLLGRRMPDLEVMTTGGARRVYPMLHAARPVLLRFSGGEAIALPPWADGVRGIDVSYAGAWVLPVIGEVDAPSWVLIRPDGYVGAVGVPRLAE